MRKFSTFNSRLSHNSSKNFITRAVSFAEWKVSLYEIESCAAAAESNLRSKSCDVVGPEHTEISLEDQNHAPFTPSLLKLSDSSSETSSDAGEECCEPPEMQLTIMAFRVALLEKVATSLGVMGFVWATVVLLGGHVELLTKTDFRTVTIIILTEAARVFSRSHELEWQRAASRSLPLQSTKPKKTSMDRNISALPHADQREAENAQQTSISLEDPIPDGSECRGECQGKRHNNGSGSADYVPFEIQRTWTSTAIPFISHSNLFIARQVSPMLYFLQIMSAAVSIALSITQLSSQNFISGKNDSRTKLLPPALNVFYALALMQSLVFLVERSYWEYKIRYEKLLLQVQTRCNYLEEHSLDTVKDFFYDTYSASLQKSIFDELTMDLVGYSITEIQSNSTKQQLGGMRILLAFVKQKHLKAKTLRQIGTTPNAISRLLEMLTWKNQDEKQIRLAAASILKRLVQHSGNRFKVVAISGALESISSLLTSEEDYCVNEHNVTPLFSIKLRLRGLWILKDLTKVHSNCFRIGSIRGLMRILVTLIQVRHGYSNANDALGIKTFTVSLQLIKLLATTTGKSGNMLRDQFGRTVFLLRNLRDIIDSTEQVTSKGLALDVIISLALDNHRRERIGRTGGMITKLLTLFLNTGEEAQRDERGQQLIPIRLKAGEALNLIVLQNHKNCRRVMDWNHFPASSSLPSDLTILDRLKKPLIFVAGAGGTSMKQNYYEDPRIGACAAKLLRSLFVYFTPNEKDVIVALTPALTRMAVKSMESSMITYQEALLGLVARIVPCLSSPRYESIFLHSSYTKQTFQNEFMKMVQNLYSFNLDSCPRIRRHIVELAIVLMRQDNVVRQALKEGQAYLRDMLETVSEVENYYTMSGQIGLTRHRQTMENLIEVAITELHKQ